MKRLTVFLSFIFGFAVLAGADVILGWDLAGTTSDPWGAATIATGLDTSSGQNELTRVGLGESSTSSAFGSNGWNLTDVFNNADDYVSFTLTPSTGYQLTLTDITWERINGSSTAPNNSRWGYSVGGGSWTYQTDFGVTTVNSAGSWDFADVVNTTQSVEFRFWTYGTTAIGGGGSGSAGSITYRNAIAGDDIVLNGTITAIPEPGIMSLLAFGGLTVWRFARRRRV